MTGTARREAVEQAYREHADDVYRVAYALLRDPDAAVDATHDAFARVDERWETYDARWLLRPWLMTIVANISRDALRRRRVRTLAIPALAAQAAAAPGAAGPAADPAEAAARRALVEAPSTVSSRGPGRRSSCATTTGTTTRRSRRSSARAGDRQSRFPRARHAPGPSRGRVRGFGERLPGRRAADREVL